MKVKQQGIALIQVLLISAIITVFVIYLSQTARSQITIAGQLNDRTIAAVAIHDAESLILFNMLTKQTMIQRSAIDDSENSMSNMAYYHNQPIAINEQTVVHIQDLSGKLSAFSPEFSILSPLLLSQG